MSEPFAPRVAEPVVERPVVPLARPEATIDARRPSGPFVPLLILGLALLVWFVFQAIQLQADRDVIQTASSGQNRQIEESRKLRAAFETLYRGTLQLADGGNANARLVADELKRRGVGLNGVAPAAPSTSPRTGNQ